jgi:hypothetical protein
MEIEKREEIDPICPFCQQLLKKLYLKELHGLLGKRYVYFCPHCHKVLGVSHRKGFWMG